MKKNLILTLFFFLFFSVLVAQNGQDSVVYTLADTMVANRMLKEGVELINQNKFNAAFSKLDTTIKLYNKILGIETKEYSNALHLKGRTLFLMGKSPEAISAFEESLKIRLKIVDFEQLEIAQSYHSLAICYDQIGEYDKSIIFNLKTLTIRLKYIVSNSADVAKSYNNLGISYYHKLAFDKAIEYYQESLNIMLKMPVLNKADLTIISFSYNNLGVLYVEKKNYTKAIEYHEKSLKLRKEIFGENHPTIANMYNNIGLVYLGNRDYEKSIGYQEKAIYIYRNIFTEDYIHIGTAYNNLGDVYFIKQEYNKSTEYYKKALNHRLKNLGTNHPHVVLSHKNIANTYNKLNECEAAAYAYQKALSANRYQSQMHFDSVMNMNELIETLNQYSTTRIKQYTQTQDTTYLSQAYDLSNQALKAVAYQFKSLNTEGSKADLLKNSIGVSENALHINQLMAGIKDDKKLLLESFTNAERAKSLILFGSLRETDALSYAGIPDSLLQKESDLRIDIAFYEKRRFEEESKGKEAKDSIINSYNSQLFDLKRSYETLKDRFEKDYPDYYRLKYDLSVVGVEEVQQKLLKPDQTLLEYFVGDSSIFIFTVNKDNYKVLEVKKDFPLDSLIEAMRTGIYGAFIPVVNKDSLAGRTTRYVSAAIQLYDKLVAPIKNLLRGSVVIVPDGVLGYIPFDALLVSKPTNTSRAYVFDYLLKYHKISYCYSATILKDMVNKKHRKEPTQPFLAMAPYFKGDTATVKSDSSDYKLNNEYSNSSASRKGLDSLPYTGEEVTRLQRIMGGEAIVGKGATEAVFNQKAGNARIIHLSTHGEMDDKVGDYSYLAFTEQADSIENEWLYTRELYNLSLNADMVVLSACETGIGKLQRGEGIISLARAFAYAGAKSIVTTLWQVRDESTKDIMLLFYRNLKSGKSKDEALWLAKRDYIKTHKGVTALPFFWSGIIPIGDMHPIGKY